MRNAERIADWFAAIRRVRQAYRAHYGRELHMLQPRLYSEKMQWRKLFDLDRRFAILSDKIAVRDFIARTIGAEYLTTLLLVTDNPDAISFESLDPPYVLKSSHGSGDVLRVKSGSDLDAETVRLTLKGWLANCHGTRYDEPGYVHVPRRILAERMILNDDGLPPLERRMFVFGGRVQLTQTIIVEGYRLRIAAYHDRNWQRVPWRGESEPHPGPFPRPDRYDALLALAERLGGGFDHVRVDFYDAADRIYAGELALYNRSGLMYFKSGEPDRVLGSYWKLERPISRAIGACLLRTRKIPQVLPPALDRPA